jgi:hypothetical protein
VSALLSQGGRSQHHTMEVFIAVIAFTFAASVATTIFLTLPRT